MLWLMAKFSGQSGRWGPWILLVDFEFYMAVLGIGMGPIGLGAPLRFKTLDSQPEKSNMGPGSINFHHCPTFQKSGDDSLLSYLPCFRPGDLRKRFSTFLGRDQKDARRKVMQIRGGITSRSASFVLFVPI